MLPLVVALALTAPAQSGPAKGADRGPPSLAGWAERTKDAVVVIYGKDGTRAGQGFFVATQGIVVAAVAHGADDVVVELQDGDRRPAKVRGRDLGLAVLEVKMLDGDLGFAALGLAKDGALPGAWVLALAMNDDGAPVPALGGLRHIDPRGRWLLDVPCPPGGAILDPETGVVVAIAVERQGKTASLGVPIGAVKAWLGRVFAP